MLTAIRDGSIDALVVDAPFIKYFVSLNHSSGWTAARVSTPSVGGLLLQLLCEPHGPVALPS